MNNQNSHTIHSVTKKKKKDETERDQKDCNPDRGCKR